MLRPLSHLLAAALATLGLAACAPTAQNTQFSMAEEQRASQQIVRNLDAKGAIVEDRALNRYVNGVVARVAATRPPGAVPIRAYIVKDADVNAFTTGGGYIFINAGMLAALENEAQLAAVIAHETAHIDRGHVQAGQANRQAVQLGAALAQIAGAAAGVNPSVLDLGVGLGATAYATSFSRSQETDADDIGLRYLAAAGYNAVEGARSFEVLQRLYGNRGGFLASHPAPADRQASLNAQAHALGATRGRVGTEAHDRATRRLRRDILQYYEAKGRTREAEQVRRNLR